MQHVDKGLLAGLAATVVLSILMVIKTQAGMLPEMNAIGMLAGILGGGPPIIGWIAHFVIGVVLWGGLFALLYERIPGGGGAGRGLLFSVGAWLLMMILVMPIAGKGFFGLAIGPGAAVATLVLHLVFGLVLGATYSALTLRKSDA